MQQKQKQKLKANPRLDNQDNKKTPEKWRK